MKGLKAVGYARVSTGRQEESGAGLEDQRRLITSECERRGWELIDLLEDTASARTTNGRPNLTRALELLDAGDAEVLVAKDVSRVSRSVIDFGKLIERAKKRGWRVVVVDLGVDTTTATGEMVANVVVSIAQWEARIIGERTAAALAVKRSNGVRLGRPQSLTPATRRRIRRMRDSGMTFAAIADRLNERGVPTARGGKRWYPASARKALLS